MRIVAVESLDLDGDDAAFDLFPEIEDAFGISFGRQIDWMTAGDILRAIEEQIPPADEPGLCATSMTFYRLRRAVRELLGQPPRPSTPLNEVLGSNPSATARKLAAISALRIGVPNLSWRGGIGCLMLVAAILPLLLGLAGLIGWMLVCSAVGIGILLIRTDPGRYAETTFGDWAKRVAHQNVGHLISLGADRRSKGLWSAVAAMLEGCSGVPAGQISPETALWPMEKNRAA